MSSLLNKATLSSKQSSDSDDDIKDFENDDLENEDVLNDWLDEKDEVKVEQTMNSSVHQSHHDKKPYRIVDVPSDEYMTSNRGVYLMLCSVEDLNFEESSLARREELMRSLEIVMFQPGHIVFEEGDSSSDMFFVVECEDPRVEPFVEVTKKNEGESNEKLLTRLTKGQYFGQKYFLTKRSVKQSNLAKVYSVNLSWLRDSELRLLGFQAMLQVQSKLLS